LRILHTSDWHIGRKLGRYDRLSEFEQVLAEIEALADSEAVDLVLFSGDLFDRPVPPMDALRLGLETLERLGERRPVVAVAGNHDSPELFETLAPLLAPLNVHLVGAIKRPDDGGVIEVDTPDGRAVVACFPFLREGRVVDFLADHPYGQYSDKVAEVVGAYDEALTSRAGRDSVPLLVAHFMVNGAKVPKGPRGERALHIGEAYQATEQAVRSGPQYVAMGHMHLPQVVPGAPVPAEYAGSVLQLDFGEAGERKRAVIVDVDPGTPAKVKSVALHAGRQLRRETGTWEELSARTDLDADYLDLVVKTDGPEPGLADLARERFARLVKVRADYPRPGMDGLGARGGRSIEQLYSDYFASVEGSPPSGDLMGDLRSILEVVQHATG
jgi:exonuclease SbcD